MKKGKNKGISLIVLVITIIVMIILAGSVIITLSNSGIIGKAKDAVDKTNLKQLQEVANVLWLDAYAGGKRTQGDLEAAVLAGLTDVDTSKYNINVTASGVTVSLKGGVTPENPETPELNEYGFYYDQLYAMEDEYGKFGFVLREDGSVEFYGSNEEVFGVTDMFCSQVYEPGLMTYAKNKIAMDGSVGTVSSDGLSITMGGETAVCTFEEVHGIYKGSTYEGVGEVVMDGVAVQVNVTGVISTDNIMSATMTTIAAPSQTQSSYIELVGNNHFGYVNGSPYMYVSMDGKKAMVDGTVLTITEVPENYVEDNAPQLNMYGFYYDQMYATDWFDEDGINYKEGFVFHRDGSVEIYIASSAMGDDDLFCENFFEAGTAIYSESGITISAETETTTLTISTEDSSIGHSGRTLNYTPMNIHGIYRDYEYTGKITADEGEVDVSLIIDINNYVTATQAGQQIINAAVTDIAGREHAIIVGVIPMMVSADGMKVAVIMGEDVIILTRSNSINGGTTPEEPTANVIPMLGTYYVGATGTDVGDYTGAAATLTAGAEFPTPATGDVYVYGDYEYRYNKVWASGWADIATVEQEQGFTIQEGWNARVLDTTKASYGKILSKIGNEDVINMIGTFNMCSAMTTAPSLPNTVTNIAGAFSLCMELTNVTLPNSLEVIGKMAFMGCMKLTNVVIPNTVTSIGVSAFALSGLTSVTLPASVTSIEPTSFYCDITEFVVDANNPAYSSNGGVLYSKDMKTLVKYPAGKSFTTFVIPNSVEAIGERAFDECANVTSIGPVGSGAGVQIPASVTRIDDAAFWLCANLTTVTLPDTIVSVGENVFESCSNLTTVVTGDGLTTVGKRMFYACDRLANITLGSSINTIKESAISVCSNLSSIVIPKNITTIENYAFSMTDNLLTVYFTGTEQEWANISIGTGNEPLSNAEKSYNYAP